MPGTPYTIWVVTVYSVLHAHTKSVRDFIHIEIDTTGLFGLNLLLLKLKTKN